MGKFIPLSVPNFEGNEKKYVNDVVDQAWVSTAGACIKEFENSLSKFLNVDDIAACQSGTSAIHLSLIECKIHEGDAVIVPTLTFIAAVNPVIYQYGTPIFMDCDDSLCIDTTKLSEFCEKKCVFSNGRLMYAGKHVKAIIVVHVFGNMADMETIMDIAKKYNLYVIEDATEALGTCYNKGRYKGKYAGTIGDFGAFSFNGNKIITTGGGGAVTARNSERVEHIRYLSTQAKDDSFFFIHTEVGYNYRMTNLQAALGIAQMEELPRFIDIKRKNYLLYKEKINLIKGLEILKVRENINSNHWFYSCYVNEDFSMNNTELITFLYNHQIQTRCIWGLIHQQKMYKKYSAYKISKSLDFYNHVINLPCSTNLSEEDIDMVIEALKKAQKRGGINKVKELTSIFPLEVAA